MYFQQLIQEIRRNLKGGGENSAVNATEEGTEEQPSGSQEGQQKRPAPEKDDSSDGSEVEREDKGSKRN